MIIENPEPPVLGYDTISTATTAIYVPSESVNAYKTSEDWSKFADLIQAIP